MQQVQDERKQGCKCSTLTANQPSESETPSCKILIADLPDVMTPRDAAQVLPFSLNTIRELCASGELPARKVGRRWLISRTLLINYLHSTPSKSEE